MNIILGSGSKWRALELTKAGTPFTVMSPDIDEKAIRLEDPEALTLALAHAKADVLVGKVAEPALLITADQVVVSNGNVLGKPRNPEEARAFLLAHARSAAEVVNGVVVTNTATGQRFAGVDRAKVFYKPSLVTVIDALITKGDVMTCAGALQTEDDLMLAHMERLEGAMDSFTGMPMKLLQELLEKAET